MDNEQERDTHFQGFAELLYQDLSKLEGSHETLISEYRNKYDKQDIVRLLAQRAYDLAMHVLEHASYGSHAFDAEIVFKHVPDLTEWPKTALE